jgi:rhomboid protease GluP
MSDQPSFSETPVPYPAEAPPPPLRPTVQLPNRRVLVTYALIALTVLAFLLQMLTQSLYGWDWVAEWGVKYGPDIAQGEWWRLLTPVLLHASLVHIGFNMYALYVLGPGLERHYGAGRFLLLYLLAGFAGNVISLWLTPSPSLGSSTAIFGLLGAQGVFAYRNRQVFGASAKAVLRNVLTFALINLLIGLAPQIDNWGHMGGLLGGVLFAWLAGPVYRLEGIFPTFSLVDQHDQGAGWLGVLAVVLVFGGLAAGWILLAG